MRLLSPLSQEISPSPHHPGILINTVFESYLLNSRKYNHFAELKPVSERGRGSIRELTNSIIKTRVQFPGFSLQSHGARTAQPPVSFRVLSMARGLCPFLHFFHLKALARNLRSLHCHSVQSRPAPHFKVLNQKKTRNQHSNQQLCRLLLDCEGLRSHSQPLI